MGSVDEPAVRTCCLVCPGWPRGDARGFEVVARSVEELTPRLAVERPGVLFFPTRGPSRFFGGDVALARRVLAAVAATGAGATRAGVADGMLAARLAARSARDPEGEPVVVDRGGSAAFLAGWPVRVLARVGVVGGDLVELLGRLGLHTLGQVAALDVGSVVARFGAEGERLHVLCRGLDVAPMGLRVPPVEIVERISFEPPVEHAEAVVFAAKVLAERLLDRLRVLGLACVRASLEIETDEGARSTASWRWEQELTPTALAELVRRRLELGGGYGQGGPIAALRLVPEEVAPLTGLQFGLWGGGYADLARVERLVASLQGMLGSASVVTGEVGGGRTPLERTRWVPWGEPPRVGEGDAARHCRAVHEQPGWPGAIPSPSPARVFDPPLPAELLDASGRALTVSARGDVSGAPASLRCGALPGAGGPIVAWEGPWFHDLRWWQPRSRRRRALWRVVVCGAPGVPGGVACLVAVERGRAGVEAIHD